jgi:hypothetical protein
VRSDYVATSVIISGGGQAIEIKWPFQSSAVTAIDELKLAALHDKIPLLGYFGTYSGRERLTLPEAVT